MLNKIKMHTPLVEMDGDEMTRVLWQLIKEELILPFVDLKSEYYDLGLKNRDKTDDKVTLEAAQANKELKVAVKCATITPNNERLKEYELKRLYPSPNATIRAILDGTVFRAPIIVDCIKPYIRTWKKPITVARHAYGDVYKASELQVKEDSKAYILIKNADGSSEEKLIHDFKSKGIVQAMHNLDSSIYSYAESCFKYACDIRQDLWFSTKDTISKIYDGRFKEIFSEIYEVEYKKKFASLGIEYFYTLIDDAVARVVKSEGGFIWACKNYDGDVMSDMVSSAFGSLAMMTSVLVSPSGAYEYEAAHGTIQRHYYKYLKGEKTSSNSVDRSIKKKRRT